MDFDDLNKPLGLPKPPPANVSRKPAIFPWRGAVAAASVIVALGAVGYARVGPEGVALLIAGREAAPVREASAPAPPIADAPGVSMTDVTGSTARPTLPARAQASDVEDVAGVKVVRQGGGGAPQSMIIAVAPPPSASPLAPAPDPRLVEDAKAGPLPRIGADGVKPMEAYARPAPAPSGRPRLALVIGGMGLNPQVTSEAIERLPDAVSLAFAPYGRNLPQQVASARAGGHETLLQTPMDGFPSQAEEPGPNVLRTGAAATENISKLHWHMSRFPGYVGIAGYMGARFTADVGAMTPVMGELAGRGLFYLDDGSAPRSQAAAAGAKAGAIVVRADVAIDARLDDIDGALARLEQVARSRGSAVGAGAGLPIVIEKAARFARGLEARGIDLTPVSAMARAPDKPVARAP